MPEIVPTAAIDLDLLALTYATRLCLTSDVTTHRTYGQGKLEDMHIHYTCPYHPRNPCVVVEQKHSIASSLQTSKHLRTLNDTH